MKTLHLKIATVEGVIFDKDVVSVYFVTEKGAMGILPRRLPIIAGLKKGPSIVKVNELSGWASFYVIRGGAISHKRNETIVLAERCEKATDETAAKELVKQWRSNEA